MNYQKNRQIIKITKIEETIEKTIEKVLQETPSGLAEDTLMNRVIIKVGTAYNPVCPDNYVNSLTRLIERGVVNCVGEIKGYSLNSSRKVYNLSNNLD